MGSGRETIESGSKAHKPAASGVVVGNGARVRGLGEGRRKENKQGIHNALGLVARELAPARRRSRRRPVAAVCLDACVRTFWGGFATQREQAPSPQGFGVVHESGVCPGGSGPELTRRNPAPAHESMAETGGLAEAQPFGNPIDRQLILAQHLLGPFEAQFVEQFLITAT